MRPLIVNFGGGVNSTAMLIGMVERDYVVDAIVFADTGGEKPETYEHLKAMQKWVASLGLPEITVVQNDGKYVTLENNCLIKQMLPSLAYGFKSCSDKYKRRPVEKWTRTWMPALVCWANDEKVFKALGFDADEPHRAANSPGDHNHEHIYPLIEWGWGRDECVEVIKRAGLPVPRKSSCFFCPASTKSEVLWLKANHPDLAERAVKMERNAELTSVAGLGRRWSWEQMLAADAAQLKLFPDMYDQMPCDCFDGADDWDQA